jgi:predicted RNA polymerase sigma factor
MAGRAAGRLNGDGPSAVAERVARSSYGRLVALLTTLTGDITVAEDALADGFERALRTWPMTGVPDNAPLGRFQLEAAIQSAHCDRARTGTVDRATIIKLYRGVVAIAPTSGAREALKALTTQP